MQQITPFIHPIPHVEASVRYIQEMNLDMMDAIWLEGNMDFSGIGKQLLMEQFAIYFENALYDDELVLEVKVADCQNNNCIPGQAVYFFYSTITRTYIALQFSVKDDLITGIRILNTEHEGKPEGYIHWKFWHVDGNGVLTSDMKKRFEIILEIRQAIRHFEEVDVWETNDLFIFFGECWIMFQEYDDYLNEEAPNSLQFATLTSFMSDVCYLFKERQLIHAATSDWKLACTLNSRRMKFDVFINYSELFSNLLTNKFTVEGNTFVFFDQCISQDRILKLNDDLGFLTDFFNEVMPALRRYHLALLGFCITMNMDVDKEDVDLFVNVKRLSELRVEELRRRRTLK